MIDALTIDQHVEDFIKRWESSSKNERANFQMFAQELCDLIEVARPDPATEEARANPYTFERSVDFKSPDGSISKGRIDLYKKGCFVLEAKQSRMSGGRNATKDTADLFIPDAEPRGKRAATRAWDTLMLNARRQAEDYAKALPVADGWPPFILVCDVAHCIEVYADFTGQGKNYAQFPDRNNFRIFMEDLRDEKIRERLRVIWDAPHTLDPTKRSAQVTRDITKRLAQVSKRLEARGNNAEDVALFLMRCLFTMFAEDVKLLPEGCFTNWLDRARTNTDKFKHELAQLWQAMDKGGFATIAETNVRRFNGSLFKSATVLDLQREEIGELLVAAKSDWKQVDPAIFGTLLEQALDKDERARLGAHYTPRAYVKRLVVVTVIEPLRQEWARVQATVERYRMEAEQLDRDAALAGVESRMTSSGRSAGAEKATAASRQRRRALETLQHFHRKLCATRILDPACGTGNFLYVALELMKELENEILDAGEGLGGQDSLAWLNQKTVGPDQFLGLEINPRAAAIAELVVWLGYLQLHYRSKTGHPPEPVLDEFNNITHMDAVLTWDGWPVPKISVVDGQRVITYPNARRPDWPESEYIVGNPPFIGGQRMRTSLGDEYCEALWRVHGHINKSADFVMFWWDRAAEIVAAKGSVTQRFGFVTTNSITQTFSRRTVARHLQAKRPLSLLMAIPDHPWTKETRDAAAVRIAMTVATAGRHDGVLREVTREEGLDTDEPVIEFVARYGRINPDLTVGVDVSLARSLKASSGICAEGVKLHGLGFIVTQSQAKMLGLGKHLGLERHIRPYRNGRDLAARPRGVMAIDMFGLEADEVRQRYPEVFQHILENVKPERDRNRDAVIKKKWWLFGAPRQELRPALAHLPRYIVTVKTASHRVFQFTTADVIPDSKLIVVTSDDATILGILSSRLHKTWVLHCGGWLGVGNDSTYVKSRCFDPFPFPDCSDALKDRIRAVAEDLDAHRKARQAAHPKLTITQMYKVLEKMRAGEDLDEAEEQIKSDGLVLILKELHDQLDVLVFEAYGWPADLDDNEIIEGLVALNAERAAEEAAGTVRWLRPDYQIPRFGDEAEKARLEAERRESRQLQREQQFALGLPDDLEEMKPRYPTSDALAETAAVMRVLAGADAPVTPQEIARSFKQGMRVENRVASTLQALSRLGHIASTDDGNHVILRRVDEH